MTQTREKSDLLFGEELTYEKYEGAMVFHVFIVYFFVWLESTVKKNT